MGFDQHVIWSYGTGNVGIGEGELSGPHSANENPFNPDEIVVAEQYGNDILIINRSTGEMRVLYGERGVEGTGKLLTAAHSAHFLPSGPYSEHVLITEYRGEHRVMILHRDSGEVLWSYTDLEAPLDAIYWDDDHIMVSDRDTTPLGSVTSKSRIPYGLSPNSVETFAPLSVTSLYIASASFTH